MIRVCADARELEKQKMIEEVTKKYGHDKKELEKAIDTVKFFFACEGLSESMMALRQF